MRSNYKTLGQFIRQVNTRNSDGSIAKLLGVNLSKQLMPSVANTHGVDLTKYKVLSHNQFACKFMSVGRDEKLPIGLYRDGDKAIVSSAYYVFESKNEEVLDSQYLMMWLSRPENDRLLWFKSGADVRGSISWDDFCEIELPVPSIEKQREIVREYNVVNDRIALNEQLTHKLEDTAQAIYKQWFVDFEFPISKEYAQSIGKPELEGKSYKSFGGEMEYCEELNIQIPIGWEPIALGEVADIKAGGDRPSIVSDFMTEECNVPIYANSTENEGLYGYTNKAKVKENSITVSARGAIIGYTVLRLEPFVPIVRLIVVTPKKRELLNYLFESINQFQFDSAASAQGQLTAPEMKGRIILSPLPNTLEKYQNITSTLISNIRNIKEQSKILSNLKLVLLQRMSKA
ncbi:TPA: restriction endonuclease subunit S [Vibrio parahaemolyticus]